MNRTILQIPMSKELRDKAEKVAKKQGFSSLQETIRLFLTKLSVGELTLKIAEEPEERLSKATEKRYEKMMEEIRSGKVKTVSFPDSKSMMDYLNS